MKSKLQLVGGPRELVDLDALARMQPDELRPLHRSLFGYHLAFGNGEQARRRIAFRIQADSEGGLPESARQHAMSIAREGALRLRTRLGSTAQAPLSNAAVTGIISDHDPRLPMPGSVIVKEYRGRTLKVHVLDSGFEFDGWRFTSLSAIAAEVTGTKWNGWAFFGLTRAHGR